MPTYTELMRGFEFGPWSVLPERGLIRCGQDERRLEPKVMDVFVVLVSHDRQVVSRDQLILEVWEGRPQMDDVINRCIRELRKVLDDDARSPKYIETIQRRGYRAMLPAVLPEPVVPEVTSEAAAGGRNYLWIAAGAAVVLIALWQVFGGDGEPPTPGTRPASVAVFEFDCVQGPGAADGHLCFGFAEEIISTLQQVEDLRIVRKRTPYDSALAVDEDGFVSGSVQIIGDQVRISAQLEDARSGEVLWSRSFPASRREIFDKQRVVSGEAAGYFDPRLVASASSPQTSAEYAAQNAFDRGRFLFRERDHESIRAAIANFDVAIEENPSFGEAYLYKAYMYVLLPDYDISEAGNRYELYEDARDIMNKGVQQDPGIRDRAGTVYGFISHKRNEWAEALEETGRAVSAATAGADDFNWHSRVLASVGRMQEAVEYARRGVEVDPDNFPVTVSRMAIASFWVGDMETARQYFEQANSVEFDAAVHFLAYSLFLLESDAPVADIKSYARAGLERLAGNGVDSSWLNPVIDGIVNEADRPRGVAVLEQVAATGQVPANVELTLSVLLGETDRAMQIAHRTEDTKGGGLFEQELIFIRLFRPFREHPEFMDFLAGVGLTEYWAEAGCVWADDKLTCPE
jgi:DNA-binding winged helix-turn-helix (wHTH) protein/TolB-like protein